MDRNGLSFHHPVAYWIGCTALTIGVLLHLPMLQHAAHMGYHMAGMPMDANMLTGMAMIPIGLLLAIYGLTPRLTQLRQRLQSDQGAGIHFHSSDNLPLNREHWRLVAVLLVAVAVDVMKPATLGFVMPGIVNEYGIPRQTAGQLALVALIGTTIGSIVWGILADALGRRAAILLSALMFIGTAICGAMPEFRWNLVMCFLMGMSAGGLLPIAFTLMAEVVPARHRGWLLVMLGGIGTSVGYLIASGSAAILEPLFSWRILWLLGLPTGMMVIMLGRHIPESPRFLANAGLRREARAVLATFDADFSDDPGEDAPPVGDLSRSETGGFRSLILGPYRSLTYGLVGCGVTWGLVNFGFMLWLPTNLRSLGISGADGLLAQSALLAIPGILLATWLYHRWSSIRTLVLFVALTAVVLLMFVVITAFGFPMPVVIMLLTALLLISANGVIAMLIPYAAEIYPVHLRGTGAGVIAASSKLGGILGALLGVMTDLLASLPASAILIACPMAVSAIMLTRAGVDTRGRRLEDIQLAIVRKTGA